MGLQRSWGDGNSGMNTKNFLCSPFVHVFLMVGFLLFSLGCPSSRNESSLAIPPPAADSSVAASSSLTPHGDCTREVADMMSRRNCPIECPAEPVSVDGFQRNRAELGPILRRYESLDGPPQASATDASLNARRERSLESVAIVRRLGSRSDIDIRHPQPAIFSINSRRKRSDTKLADLHRRRIVQAVPNAEPPADASAKKRPADSPKELRPPLDLIRENGEFFAGWPKPKLALLITGKIEGYLEPCGCAGIERMKGGMGRRFMLFKQLREQGWPVVGLDVGGMARGFGRQAEIKFHTLVEGMRAMNYEAITLGETDLKLPAGELVAETAAAQNQKSPFVSANVGLFGFDSDMIAKTRIIEAGGKKIGITAVLGKSFQKEIQNAEIEFADPEKAIQQVLPELQKNANLLILLAHATMEESIALAKKFPQFSVVVTSGGQPDSAGRTAKRSKARRRFSSKSATKGCTPSCWASSTTRRIPSAISALCSIRASRSSTNRNRGSFRTIRRRPK